MNVRPEFLALCTALTGACAASTTAEPAVEHAAAPVAREPSVVLAPGLEPATPACDTNEAAQPNAVDDDCDGRIDQLPNGPGLSVAFSTGSAAELDVALVDATGNSVAPSQREPGSEACTGPGFRTASAQFASLPPAPARLVLTHVRSCGEPVPATAAVALTTAEGARTYLVTLEPGASLTLAELVSAR